MSTTRTTQKVYSLTLPTGTLDEVEERGVWTIQGAYPLGKTTSGDSVYVLETTPSTDGDAIDEHIFVQAQDAVTELSNIGMVPSPVWGTNIFVATDNGLGDPGRRKRRFHPRRRN